MKVTDYKDKQFKEISKEEAAEILEHDCYDAEDGVYAKDKNNDLYLVRIIGDDCTENPREWDNICTIVSAAGRDWNIADKGFSFKTHEECMKILGKPDTYFLPIYMYDHSGQTISLSSFGDPWDSGVCGFIFVTKEQMKKAGYDVSDEETWHKEAEKIMDKEIEVYDYYIKGECYAVRTDKLIKVRHINEDTGEQWDTVELEFQDCLGGFLGTNILENGMLDDIDIEDCVFLKEVM